MANPKLEKSEDSPKSVKKKKSRKPRKVKLQQGQVPIAALDDIVDNVEKDQQGNGSQDKLIPLVPQEDQRQPNSEPYHLQRLQKPVPVLTPVIPMSPRKQSIMRYKTSDDKINERSYINQVKDGLREPKENIRDVKENYELLPQNLYIEDKVTLFTSTSATILSYAEQINGHELANSGRLLNHGFFEIFQLHNGDVTYMACGPNFIYPLLPKLKIMRISFNEFILPLVNPERYWKILIEEHEKVGELERTLEGLVQYKSQDFHEHSLSTPQTLPQASNNVFEAPKNLPQASNYVSQSSNYVSQASNSVSQGSNNIFQAQQNAYPNSGVLNGHSAPATNGVHNQPEIPQEIFADASEIPINAQPNELKTLSIIDESEPENGQRISNSQTFDFHQISSFLPESPPSAPISPHPEKYDYSPKSMPLAPGWSLNRKVSNITNMACLDLDPKSKYDFKNDLLIPDVKHEELSPSNKVPINGTKYANIHHPKPKRATKPCNIVEDDKSDSSMDSLLDEYEDSISYAKSVSFQSRPVSRRPSVSSTVKRPQYFKEADNRHSMQFEDFPTTSLSEYNRVRNSSRSVKSSRSELYASESNWMEPLGVQPPDGRLAKMRSSQSMGAKPAVDLNSTYRNIYRSITERNLNSLTVDKENRSPSDRNGSSRSRRSSISTGRGYVPNNQVPSLNVPHLNVSQKLQHLDAAEVYKLINARRPNSRVSEMRQPERVNEMRQPEQKSSFASRLFGW